MFEHEQEIVRKLLTDDAQFRALYNRHSQLKQEVRDAEDGAAARDDATLSRMKKEKLQTKDKMAAMIARYRRENLAASAGSAGQ